MQNTINEVNFQLNCLFFNFVKISLEFEISDKLYTLIIYYSMRNNKILESLF